jgi:acetylglutamate kinase
VNTPAPEAQALPVVIKIGGRLLDDAVSRQSIVASVTGSVRPIVVVHGGGDTVDVLLTQLGITTPKVNGLRATGPDAIGPVVGVLAGLVNKSLTASLRAHGCNAVGLCLGDGGALQVTKVAQSELGFVGEVTGGDARLWSELLASGRVPVIASIGFANDGLLLNVNADDAAAGAARALNAHALLLVTDTHGVLDAAGAVIPSLDQAAAQALQDAGVIHGGMVPKVRGALAAAERVGSTANAVVRIVHWSDLNRALSGEPVGTAILSTCTAQTCGGAETSGAADTASRRPRPVERATA